MPNTDHYCEISYSKDGGHNWSQWTPHSLGATGQFQTRVLRTRLGLGRQWVFRVRVSSPIRRDLLAGAVKIETEQ